MPVDATHISDGMEIQYPPDVPDEELVLSSPESSPLERGNIPLGENSNSTFSRDQRHHAETSRPRGRHRSSRAQTAVTPAVSETDVHTLLSLLKKSHVTTDSLSTQLVSTQASLALYKAHLEYAQRELDKASEVVKAVDAQRREAEEAAIRARERERGLRSEWEIWVAREEGRREGWRKGLEHGRRMNELQQAWKISEDRQSGLDATSERMYSLDGRVTSDSRSYATRRRGASTSSRRYMSEKVMTPIQSTYQSHRTRSRKGTSDEGTASSSSRTKSKVPDVAPFGPPPPVPTVTTPQPIQVHPTQPQQPREKGTSAGQGRPRSVSDALNNSTKSQQSSVPLISERTQPDSRPAQKTENSHPIPIPPRVYHDVPAQPSASHRNVVVPPDNYIPTQTVVEGEPFIVLPPPHELSRPASTVADDENVESRSFVSERTDRHRPRTAPDRSTASRASTRISEYDIVSPPRGTGLKNVAYHPGSGVQTPTRSYTPTAGPATTRGRPLTPTERMVEQWRRQNSDLGLSSGRQSVASSTHSRRFKVMNPDEDQKQEMRSMRSISPHGRRTPMNGPRQPREIVLPVPLTDPLARINETNSRQDAPRIPRNDTPFIPPLPSNTPDAPPVIQADVPQEMGNSGVRAKTPLAWLRNKFQRTQSSPGDVNIRVEPPSASPSSNSGTNTVVDPVLLTPEQAPQAIPSLSLDEVITDAVTGKSLLPSIDTVPNDAAITVVLPDNQLPAGFVPLSPMFPTNIVAMNMTSAQPTFSPREGDPGPSRSAENAVPGSSLSFGGQQAAGGYHGFSSPAPLNRPFSIFSSSES